MSIIAGLVSIEDGIKSVEEYAPARKVKVELSFGVDEGADAMQMIDATAQLANAKVTELLGIKPTAGRRAKATAKEVNPTAAEVSAPVETKSLPGDELLKPIIDKELEILGRHDRLAAGETPNPIAPTEPAKPDPVKVAPAGEPTHADLYKAVTSTQAAINNAVAIRALIQKATADLPVEKQTVGGVPADRRAALIAELEALKSIS